MKVTDPNSPGKAPERPPVEPEPSQSTRFNLVLGRPLKKPGETREQAARRLAEEMFAALHEERPPSPVETEPPAQPEQPSNHD